MNAIEIRNLTKHYVGFSLENLNLTLPSGCIMGLVGENGAGKSTTIRMLLGMARPDGGEITVFGQKMDAGLRERIGVVLDEPGYPGCMTAAQIGKMLAGLYKGWEKDTFEGYLTSLRIPENKPFKDFSKGMKMKLCLAAALSHGAKLLILDEATSGLDPVVRDELLDIFNDFTRDEGNSVLISSHIVSDLEKICDYIAFLHRGKLMLCREKDELLNHAKEKRREFIQQIAVKLKPLGFKKKANTWTRTLDGEYYVMFNAQKSAFSDEYYFNVYIGKNGTNEYGDCFHTRVAPQGMSPMDWQALSRDEFEIFLDRTVVPALEQIIKTPLQELGKIPSYWNGCPCKRNKCQNCWMEKNLWEAKEI